MKPEWYGLLKTGNAEVDNQHVELETMLQELIDGDVSEVDIDNLRTFQDALQSHFKYEEVDAQLADDAHIADHCRILAILADEAEKIKANPSDLDTVAMEIAWELTKHVSTFDVPLEEG